MDKLVSLGPQTRLPNVHRPGLARECGLYWEEENVCE